MKIGLIADTHMPGSIAELWPQAYRAFEDVDLILHAGDLHTLDIVDELEKLAPVHVARGNGDAGLEDNRLRENWLLELRGLQIGMIHKLPSPVRRTPEQIFKYTDRHFESVRPDILIYGHTHLEGIHQVENMVCINPGSPTLPSNQSLRLGTIGILEIGEQHAEAIIYQITEQGVDSISAVRIGKRLQSP